MVIQDLRIWKKSKAPVCESAFRFKNFLITSIEVLELSKLKIILKALS